MNESDCFGSFPTQGGSDQSAHPGKHPRAAVPGRQHLHHLLRSGSLPEAGAAESRAHSVGEKRGLTRAFSLWVGNLYHSKSRLDLISTKEKTQ